MTRRVSQSGTPRSADAVQPCDLDSPTFIMPFYMREDIEDVDVPADGAQLVSIWVSKPTVHSKVGITMESDADKAPTIVIETSPGGPAAVAGLRKGDHIIRINGVKVSAARLERMP